MISTASFSAMLKGVLDQAKAAAGTSKLSWSLFGDYLDQLKRAAMLAAVNMAIDGYQKKQIVLEQIDLFIDQYLPLPAWLFFARPWIKSWFHNAADGAIESFYRDYIKPNAPPTPTPAD